MKFNSFKIASLKLKVFQLLGTRQLTSLPTYKLTNSPTFKLTHFFLLFLLFPYTSNAQTTPDPIALIDKAVGKAIENGNVGINFEGIAYGLQQPTAIFTLPVYQVVRGGFFYLNGSKYEMQLGAMKTLSDGQLMVVIDEVSKTMYVDSLQHKNTLDSLAPEMDKLFTDIFGEGNMQYQGEEMVNGKLCHKIKSTFTKGDNTHVYYWITKATEQLYLMAEWQNKAYDVYWFTNIAKAPATHDYSVNLPKKEIDTYYGYNVIDNRFMQENLK